uniref:Methyltransferase type 11 domain-containing protein n=1 Tax=Neogobius melanostomus TaxID=47308 RepID=A0A8C6UMU1_9GOBI
MSNLSQTWQRLPRGGVWKALGLGCSFGAHFWQNSPKTNMAVRCYEDKDHTADYLKYRLMPNEMVGKIMGMIKQKMPLPAPLAVDVGCGSGQGTVLLAPYFHQVVGTDISPSQLENTQANQTCPNVSYRQCPAEQLPFENGTVDLVTAMTAAHWFDRPRFLEEAYRVLKPGGCLTLLSYTLDMDVEYGDVSEKLKEVCKEFYAPLLPFRDPHLGSSSLQIYKDMFNSCPYPEKEWCECFEVRRPVSLNRYMGIVQTFTSFRKFKEHDSQQAEELSNRIRQKLMDTMQVSSPATEITMVTKYFYWVAWKP